MNTYYWSRRPGCFVNKKLGIEIPGCSFTGTVREWYETMVETIIDVKNYENLNDDFYIVVPRDILTILECTVLYSPNIPIGEKYDPSCVGYFKHFEDFPYLNDCKIYRNDDVEPNEISFVSNGNVVAILKIKNMDII